MKKAFWWRAENFGDRLTPFVLEHFLKEKIEFCNHSEPGRIIGIGSIVRYAVPGDIVFGSGSNRPRLRMAGEGVRFLAVRGPLTRAQIVGGDVPEIYGDPAILLPLMYRPTRPIKFKRGILPHYVDKAKAPAPGPDETVIDIQADDWRTVIDRILECEEIVSSTLHGIIAAEAYGVPTRWAVWGEKIIGGPFKFQDYFLGTGRPEQRPGELLPPIENLAWRQGRLLGALEWLKKDI